MKIRLLWLYAEYRGMWGNKTLKMFPNQPLRINVSKWVCQEFFLKAREARMGTQDDGRPFREISTCFGRTHNEYKHGCVPLLRDDCKIPDIENSRANELDRTIMLQLVVVAQDSNRSNGLHAMSKVSQVWGPRPDGGYKGFTTGTWHKNLLDKGDAAEFVSIDIQLKDLFEGINN